MYKINLLIGFLLLIPTNSAVTKAETAKTVGSKVDNWTLAVMGLLALGSKTVSCSDSDKPDFDSSSKIISIIDTIKEIPLEELKFNAIKFNSVIMGSQYIDSIADLSLEDNLKLKDELRAYEPVYHFQDCIRLLQIQSATTQSIFTEFTEEKKDYTTTPINHNFDLRHINFITSLIAGHLRSIDRALTNANLKKSQSPLDQFLSTLGLLNQKSSLSNSPTLQILPEETYQLYLKTYFLKYIFSYTISNVDKAKRKRYLEFNLTTAIEPSLQSNFRHINNYLIAFLSNYLIDKNNTLIPRLCDSQDSQLSDSQLQIETEKNNSVCIWLIKQCLRSTKMSSLAVKLEVENLFLPQLNSNITDETDSILIPVLYLIQLNHAYRDEYGSSKGGSTYRPYYMSSNSSYKSKISKLYLVRLAKKLKK